MAVDESFFAEVLGIKRPWNVGSVELNADGSEAHVYVNTARGSMFTCPVCGKECKVHDFYERTWRDLDLGRAKTTVHARIPRTECPEHGVKQISVEWAREYSRQTLNFERKCMEMMKEMPLNAVSRIMRISDDALWNILTSYVNAAMEKVDMSKVTKLGVDETSCRRGHDYIALFVDMDSHHVLFAVPGRGSDTVGEFAKWLESHGGSVANITDISCDMSSAFISGINENFPGAKITLDRFHVMHLATDAVDEVRKDVQASKKVSLKIRYQLLTRKERLSEEDSMRLNAVLKENMLIGSAYIIKEMLGDLYLLDSEEHGRMHLTRWVSLASKGVHKAIKRLAATVSKHFERILRWFASRLSNGVLEGINSVIQAVKRMARGYKVHENMITMLYLRGAGVVI